MLVYLVCWAPQVWFIITSILTEIPPNFQNDYNAKLFAAIRSLANPALILSFDSSIRKQVWIFVGLATANSQASIPARTPTSLRASRKLTKDISSMDEFRATNTDHGVQPSISNISKVLEIIRTKSADADLGYSNLSVPTSPSENFKKRHIGGRGIDENSLKSPDLASNAESDDEAKGKNGNIIIGLKSEPESTTSSRTTSNFSNTNKNIDADQITVSHSNQSRTRRSRPHEETSLGRRPAEEHSIASIRHMMDARSNRAAEENSLGKRPMGESSMTSIRAQSLFDSESLVPDRVLTRRHSPINGDTATSSSASPSIINFNDTENPSQASSSRNLASKSDGSSSPKKRSPKEYDQSASIVSNLKNNIPSVLQEEPNTINNDGSIRNFDLGNISDHESGQKPRKHSPNGNDPRDSDRQSYDQVQTVPHKIRVHGNLESSLVSSSPSSPGSPPSFKASSDFRSSSRVQSSSNSQTGSRANVASGRDSLKMGSTTESQRMIIIEEKSGMESDGELRKNI